MQPTAPAAVESRGFCTFPGYVPEVQILADVYQAEPTMNALADAIIDRTGNGDNGSDRWAVLSPLTSIEGHSVAGAALLAGEPLPTPMNADLLVLVTSQGPAMSAVHLIERVISEIRFALAHRE